MSCLYGENPVIYKFVRRMLLRDAPKIGVNSTAAEAMFKERYH